MVGAPYNVLQYVEHFDGNMLVRQGRFVWWDLNGNQPYFLTFSPTLTFAVVIIPFLCKYIKKDGTWLGHCLVILK